MPLLWFPLVLASCMGPASMHRPMHRGPSYSEPTQVTGRELFAPSTIGAEVEAERLAAARAPAGLLRRAWLELELRRPEAALDTTATVLFAPERVSSHDESFARYLRAEAYRLQGHPERGRYDLDRARTLALDPDLQRRLLPREVTAPAATGNPLAGLAIQPRTAWQPRPVVQRLLDPMRRPSRVTIHHSAMLFRDTRAAASAAQIARIQREHMTQRSPAYGDIGYHFLIDPSGRIWEGRDLRYQGAHAGGDNNIANIGICLLGNFMNRGDSQGPTAAQVRSMEQLVVQLMRGYGIDGNALFCHSDFKNTECPGPRMRPIVQRLAQRLQERGGYVAGSED